jgi:hypothetical protein
VHPKKGSGAELDKTDEIVQRAIDYTDLVLINTPAYAPAAVAGLRRLRDTLAASLPDHPGVLRLSDYIATFEADPGTIN